MDENKLEEKSKQLLLWKISGEDFPSFGSIEEPSDCIDYLKKEGYLSGVEGQTPKSFLAFPYHVTEKGREWAGVK